jgi:hypothetical protein
MKYLIVLLLCFTAFSQEIVSTTQYNKLIDQAEAEYEVTVAKAKKARDAKIKKVMYQYTVALKTARKKAMMAGDLEKANKIDKEIKALEAMLSDKPQKVVEAKAPKMPEQIYNRVYNWSSSMECHFLPNGSFMAGKRGRLAFRKYGSWEYDNGIFIVRYEGRTARYKFADDLSYYQGMDAKGVLNPAKASFRGKLNTDNKVQN